MSEEQTVNEEVTESVQPEPEYSPEDIEEAKFLGWKSPDEWVGERPPGYIDDPKRYIERVANTKPFQALTKRLEETEKQYQDRLRKLESMQDVAVQRMQQDHQRQLDEIRQAKLKAVQTADEDEYKALDEREKALAREVRPKDDNPWESDPFLVEYKSSAQWVNNPLLVEQASKLIDMNPAVRAMSAKDQVTYAESELKKMYPTYFAEEKPAKKPVASRADGGGAVGAYKADPFTALPADAQKQFRKFVDLGVFKDNAESRKQYADDYNAA